VTFGDAQPRSTPVRQGRRRAVLKLGMPHMEGRDEIQGLRFWGGDPTVHLLDADRDTNAMLLEACEPGHSLRSRPEPEQDVVIAALLRRLWRQPGLGHSFRPPAVQTAFWSAETANDRHRWPDAGQEKKDWRSSNDCRRRRRPTCSWPPNCTRATC
jgi:streptomycin 6-kinase